jgi:transcriptional regulator with GAF, ATPase, and Fis domain
LGKFVLRGSEKYEKVPLWPFCRVGIFVTLRQAVTGHPPKADLSASGGQVLVKAHELHERGSTVEETDMMDTYFYAISRVIDAIYMAEEELADILYFIVSLATELTHAKGSTIRVLEHGTFDLKLVSSYGLSQRYLNSGAIDLGKSMTEITEGDTVVINDFENDPRIQNLAAAKTEGVSAVIGIPFTVNETTYSILRIYFSHPKTPTHEEMELLASLGRLSCLAIERAAISRSRA